MTPEMSEQIFNLTLSGLSALVTLVFIPMLRAYGAKLTSKLEAEGKDARLVSAVGHLGGLVEDAVLEVEQTYVRRMKAHGKWDKDAAQIARDTAVSVTMRHLNDGASDVMDAMGIHDPKVFAGKLRTMVEASVSRANGKSQPTDTGVFVPMLGMDEDESDIPAED